MVGRGSPLSVGGGEGRGLMGSGVEAGRSSPSGVGEMEDP